MSMSEVVDRTFRSEHPNENATMRSAGKATIPESQWAIPKLMSTSSPSPLVNDVTNWTKSQRLMSSRADGKQNGDEVATCSGGGHYITQSNVNTCTMWFW